ncbi:MAG TPA: C4-type zinc ribbon domain-containing protein [Blastocatellia bacterium]|nr:C4-type zinc ribbon domain-containing protein [Blastocatellia bacterium]
MNPDLTRLIALQETDLELKRLREEIASLPLRQEQIERQFAESVKEYLALEQESGDLRAERERLEGEVEAEQQKLQKFKDDLMRATNEREYTTAVREIDAAKKSVGTMETEILKLMERVEKLDAQVNERKPEIEGRRVEVDRRLAETETAVSATAAQLAALEAERRQLHETLSPSARATYDRVSRLKGGVALAEARAYSCLACRMKIRPQVFSDIRRGESLITCESCGRVLYYKAEAVLTQ